MICEYLLDTNIYIQAWNLRYPESVFPGFWAWFQDNHQSGRFRTIDKVFQELRDTNPVYIWVKDNAKRFDTSDNETTEAYKRVMEAAEHRIIRNQNYTQSAINQFGIAADSFLIASAHAHNTILVTEETPNNQSINQVKIPDIANLLSVQTINTTNLLLALRPRFTWEKPADSN